MSEQWKEYESKAGLQEKPCCIFLNTYYDKFINDHYDKHPHLQLVSYQQQLQSLQWEFFGDSDFYSEGLKKAGWDAEDLIINCGPLQRAWGQENDFGGQGLDIAVEQVRRKKPDVLYLQDLNGATSEFLSAIRPYTQLVVGQIATPIVQKIPFEFYDIIFSSFPHYIDQFRQMGLAAYYQPLAFDSRILDRPQAGQRSIASSFVGGISSLHVESYELLEMLAKETPTQFWGYGTESLPNDSAIHARHHGPVWGMEMFKIFGSSMITINRHGEVAEDYANNMRLFEATGCGAMLLTDYKENLNELFEIGKEVVAYRSPEEAVSLIKYYSRYPDEAQKIASAGQQRTLKDHCYGQRMVQTAEILRRHLRYKNGKDCYPVLDMAKISYGWSSIEKAEITENLTSAWQNEDIAIKQRSLVQKELKNLYKGKPSRVYKVLADVLRPNLHRDSSILEIGCASGYYYEILNYLLNRPFAYTGVDYSEPLIAMARDYYPRAEFIVSDGANLPFADNQFSVAISSGMLLHVSNYREHIAETVRVAGEFVVVHRTPVCRKRETQYFKKFAYGAEMVELRFNEKMLISEFASHGLNLIGGMEYYTNPGTDEFELTYVFKKMNVHSASKLAVTLLENREDKQENNSEMRHKPERILEQVNAYMTESAK